MDPNTELLLAKAARHPGAPPKDRLAGYGTRPASPGLRQDQADSPAVPARAWFR